MPRTNIDYSKTSIYKICCKDLNITAIYIGHTTDFRRRKNQHKSNCINEKNKKYNINVYQFIRANGNWNNWNMIEIEKYYAIDANDAKKRERYYIELLKANLNFSIPTRTKKEYDENNKEILKEYQKEYYEHNKEILKEYKKEYYENNKEKIKEREKEYYENNKEKELQKKLEKITCKCGCILSRTNLARHLKTKKHQELLN